MQSGLSFSPKHPSLKSAINSWTEALPESQPLPAPLLRPVRILRLFHVRWRILPNRLRHLKDRALELRVSAARHFARVIHDVDVWINAIAFDNPFAGFAVDTKRGHAHAAAINEGG